MQLTLGCMDFLDRTRPVLDRYRGEELNPGAQVESDADIDAWLRKTVITAHHPCGTCPMGATPGAVNETGPLLPAP